MGCVEYRRLHGTPTRIVAVDSEGSTTFGGPPGRRQIPGLGASRRPELFVDSDEFDKVIIPERETVMMCREVAREHGLLIGGSTGTVLAAARRLSEEVESGSRVVVISPDLGDKYLDTIYSDIWVGENLPRATVEVSGRFHV